MEQKTRIRAVDRTQWIMMLACAFISAALLFWKEINIDPVKRILLIIVAVVFTPSSIYHLCHDTFLAEEGIKCCRFGKVIRTLPWRQVSQVCIVRDRRRARGTRVILIVPQGCPAFSPQEWTGVRYLLTFRDQAIWIDHTSKNCALIEKYWGNVTPLHFK